MKLKNRKGSTLALTLMVFAVLMIFATFILGFMVTENKQAMHHQNKTQAYYIARSGAEAVEAAILEVYNDEDNSDEIDFFGKIVVDRTILMDPLEIDGEIVNVTLSLDNIVNDENNFLLNIEATTVVGNAENKVQKFLNIPRPINKIEIKATSPIIYISGINNNIKEINTLRGPGNPLAVQADATKPYPLNITPSSFPIDILFNTLPTSGSISGNYFVENLNGNDLKNLKFESPVNIYVKGVYSIDASSDLLINSTGEAKNLNIYTYGEGVTFKGENGKNIIHNANLYVKTGYFKVNAHKLEYKGNIVLGENVTMDINVEDNGSVGHANIEGMIYGPKSVINIGDSSKGALSVDGSIIGNYVNFLYKVENLSSLKLSVDNSGGIKNPIEFENQIITTIQKGYFK